MAIRWRREAHRRSLLGRAIPAVEPKCQRPSLCASSGHDGADLTCNFLGVTIAFREEAAFHLLKGPRLFWGARYIVDNQRKLVQAAVLFYDSLISRVVRAGAAVRRNVNAATLRINGKCRLQSSVEVANQSGWRPKAECASIVRSSQSSGLR